MRPFFRPLWNRSCIKRRGLWLGQCRDRCRRGGWRVDDCQAAWSKLARIMAGHRWHWISNYPGCLCVMPIYFVSLILAFGLGLGFMVQFTMINTLLQTRVDDQLRGRVMALYTLTFSALRVGNLQSACWRNPLD